jgi:hypothetical protein
MTPLRKVRLSYFVVIVEIASILTSFDFYVGFQLIIDHLALCDKPSREYQQGRLPLGDFSCSVAPIGAACPL